jgi:hypothetical protein
MELCFGVDFNKYSYVKKIIENSGISKDVEFQKKKHASGKWVILIYEIDSMILSESVRDNINLNLGKGVLPNYYTVYTAKFEVELYKKETVGCNIIRDGEKFYAQIIQVAREMSFTDEYTVEMMSKPKWKIKFQKSYKSDGYVSRLFKTLPDFCFFDDLFVNKQRGFIVGKNTFGKGTSIMSKFACWKVQNVDLGRKLLLRHA